MSILIFRTIRLPAIIKNETAWGKRADFAALSAWLIASFFMTFTSWQSPGHDFRGYYAAARVLTAGGNPYDYTQVAPVLLSVTGHMGNNPHYYPPWFAWCFTPISCLPFQTARCIWLLFNLTIWIISLLQLNKLLDWPERGWRRWLMFLLATYIFAGVTLHYEQIGIVLFALFVAVISAVRKEQWHLAGVWLALLLIKPNITFIPVIAITTWLARRGQWRPVVVMCTLIASLFIVTTIATPDWYQPFFQQGFGRGLVVSFDGPNRITGYIINTTLLDWLKMLHVGESLRKMIYILVVIGGVYVCTHIVRKSKSILHVLATSLLVSFAITPYAFQYDYPPLTLMWFLATESCTSSMRAQWGGVAISIFITSVLIWERPISDGYWIVIGLCLLSIWSWWHSDSQKIPQRLL